MSESGTYRAVPTRIDLPAMEREVLAFWSENDIFNRSLEATAGGEPWIFYEGPPTANGKPGTHHVEARVFKDVFPRYRTMKGRHVPRRAGWDCHGLPVEIAIEKELGFSGKQDIEAYGVAEFNARCRESVLRHVNEFTVMTERMGYWVDFDDAYWTMNSDYIQSVWWSLKQIFDANLLVEDHRVSPYCPRCGTGLSDHELAQGYETVVDPSVFVRFPVTSTTLTDRYPGLALLVWTTTPWTLVSNTAVAVKPDAQYAVARTADGELLVVVNDLVQQLLGDDAEVLETFPGRDLERVTYQRPFDLIEIPDAHIVVLAEYVTTDDGSGLVHQSPAFGADDLAVCRAYNLPVVNPVRPDGHFESDVPLVGDLFFKKADTVLVNDLMQRGLLFRHVPYEHSYPHCWRCHTPLIYYAQPSWYIRTTAIKDALLRENGQTNWYPPTIQWGRYGDWLTNNVDWAISRNRYWGTPLPIWRCPDNHLSAIGSLAELGERAGLDLLELDPHRPFVDDIEVPCHECGLAAQRVPEVIDCWYDSGAMPFAQLGYPHRNVSEFEQSYPADFICEAIDQTRGWFYTLMAIGTLVFDRSSYRNVVCLGHILDEQGRKMSKHLGNVLEPVPLMDDHGADAVRWFMLAGGSPWQARRVGHTAIADVVRKTLLTYWNTVSFLSLYARTSNFEPATAIIPPVDQRTVLDRWVLSEANRVAREVDSALEEFDTQRAGRELATFIDDLSNWYVRRSRRRFWEGDLAALATLHEALHIITLLMAPFTPFITERVWADMFAHTDPSLPESVHLARWPEADPEVIDDNLATQMDLVRRVVELGRGARAEGKAKTRQPLARALVSAHGWDELPDELRATVAEELNVISLDSLGSQVASELVDVVVKANFRSLGQRFAKDTPRIAAVVAESDAAGIASALRETGSTSVHVDGLGEVVLTADDVVITETPREGWSVASDAGASVALDLHLTDELVVLGTARELVRLIQEARKSAGFDVSDRIALNWTSENPTVISAFAEHGQLVAGEVLATVVSQSPEQFASGYSAADDELGATISVSRA